MITSSGATIVDCLPTVSGFAARLVTESSFLELQGARRPRDQPSSTSARGVEGRYGLVRIPSRFDDAGEHDRVDVERRGLERGELDAQVAEHAEAHVPQRYPGTGIGPATTPRSWSRPISASLIPSSPASTASVCCPSAGARSGGRRSAFENTSGEPGMRKLPIPGCSTSSNIGFADEQRGSSVTSWVNVW